MAPQYIGMSFGAIVALLTLVILLIKLNRKWKHIQGNLCHFSRRDGKAMLFCKTNSFPVTEISVVETKIFIGNRTGPFFGMNTSKFLDRKWW